MLKLETFNSLHTKLCQTGSSQPRQTPGEVENPLLDFSQPRQTPGEEEKPLLDFSQPRQTPGEEEKPLLDTGSSTSANECLKCKMLSACALCVDCNCFYCEICCDTHTKGNPKHKVCMIEHTIKSVFDVNCSKCKKKEPTVVCTTCKKVLCDNCTCEHEADRVNIELIKHKPRAKRTISSCSSELEILQEIKIKNVHVCGICILDDGQIVIGDRKNGQLLMPIKVDEIDTFNLKFEPRGLVHMYGKKIAVTSSHDKKIIIFELGNPSWTESDELKCDDKPFSISYNDDHFAVEFEESEDGFIGILTTGGKMVHRIQNTCDFAYFTGNTIRLALDMKRGLVFVSALSKKLVSCVDFSGKIVWHVPISSPRGIIFVPGIAVGHKNIVCASKRHNTVYEMGSENGDFEVLLSGSKIPGPRYITYSLQLKKLCIQADNGQFLVYKYKIY
ncbi:uncharacterized protein [Mytilus edulis]|uniref:uncharacterized protein isoform X2 n=1 Tax=Mytilus edulis TaxID=6550 RepID=UPI0039F122C6